MKRPEGESKCYIGLSNPTIMGFEKIQRCTDPVLKPLVMALTAGLHARFNSGKNDPEYITATVLHPMFKLAFLNTG